MSWSTPGEGRQLSAICDIREKIWLKKYSWGAQKFIVEVSPGYPQLCGENDIQKIQPYAALVLQSRKPNVIWMVICRRIRTEDQWQRWVKKKKMNIWKKIEGPSLDDESQTGALGRSLILFLRKNFWIKYRLFSFESIFRIFDFVALKMVIRRHRYSSKSP